MYTSRPPWIQILWTFFGHRWLRGSRRSVRSHFISGRIDSQERKTRFLLLGFFFLSCCSKKEKIIKYSFLWKKCYRSDQVLGALLNLTIILSRCSFSSISPNYHEFLLFRKSLTKALQKNGLTRNSVGFHLSSKGGELLFSRKEEENPLKANLSLFSREPDIENWSGEPQIALPAWQPDGMEKKKKMLYQGLFNCQKKGEGASKKSERL